MIEILSPGFITSIVIFLTVLLIGKKLAPCGVCRITKDLSGQIVLITGANTGIGKETAQVLAQMKATVVLACRDPKRSLPVVEDIKTKTGNPNVEFMQLDLADLESVKTFAENFRKKYKSLNILINNAGIMALPDRTTTKDGFEAQFGTNHVGHFYLTKLLLDIVEKSAPSRIINLSSRAHYDCRKINWDDIMYEKNYSMIFVYAQSKLANVLFTKELQKRVASKNVKVVSVHPGAVRTELARYIRDKWYLRILYYLAVPFLYWLGKSPIQGAQTTLYCALEDHEKLQGGMYYSDCIATKENRLAEDEKNWTRMWDLTEELIAKTLKK